VPRRAAAPGCGRLAYYSHWITQPGRPRRYDTRFFVAEAPAAQTPSHDNSETIGHVWIRPAEALERHRRGKMHLVFPTIKTLESIAVSDNAAALMEFARSPRKMPAMAPRSAATREGTKLLVPGDFAYAEVGKLDRRARARPLARSCPAPWCSCRKKCGASPPPTPAS